MAIRQCADFFFTFPYWANSGVIHMIVKRGTKASQYQSSCVNGEVKTVSQGTVSTQELQEHEQQQEETQRQRRREELQQLQPSVNQALPFSGIIGAHCFSDDTKLLTKDGWRGIDAVAVGTEFATLNRETGGMEYHPASAIYVYPYDGDMYHMVSSCADHLVTPNHNMLYESYGTWKEVRAEDFYVKGAKIPVSGVLERTDLDLYENDDELRLHVWCVTDGHVTYMRARDGYMTYRFRFKKSRKIERLTALLNRLGYARHTGVETGTGVTWITVSKMPPKFTKVLMEEHRRLSPRQTGVLIEEWSHTDDRLPVYPTEAHHQLFTNIKFHTNLLQELCALNNHKSTCAPQHKDGYEPCYELSIRLNVSCVKTYAMNKGTVDYNGRVWCPNVAPHHTVVST